MAGLVGIGWLLTALPAAAAPAVSGNVAAALLAWAGADTFTVELTRALVTAPDGSATAAVTPALRSAVNDGLAATQFRLAGLDEVAGAVAALAFAADGRSVRLGFPAPAAAERARVILKGYADLFAGSMRVAAAAPDGKRGFARAALDLLAKTTWKVAGAELAIEFPDPAPLQAALAGEAAAVRKAEPAPADVCRSNLATLEGATELFRMEKGEKVFPDLAMLVTEGYLRTLPACPGGGAYALKKDGPPRCSKHGTVDEILRRKAESR